MERGQGESSVTASSQVDVIDTIRATLLAIGGDDAIRLFRSGCFEHFLDYRGGDVQKRVIYALITYEEHVPDRARVGREVWFHIHHSQLRFGPSEYALVSGLRFDGLTFDPNGDHIVPSRSVYHRLFEGKRTTIKQMEDRFKQQGMARDASDYVKVANILFVYRMIMCLDQYRVVDPWVWALAEDVERWNAFPWGAYSYQALMHYIGLVPRTRQAMGGKGSGHYHFYGPIWALQSRVVILVPSPEETGTSYYLSLQLEPGAQSVRFVPARSENKKKMLANVASCCSTSAEEDAPEHTADPVDPESPPRAWGRKRSRSDRSQSSGEPSESFLQRVVDAVMPRVRELIDTTIAPRVARNVPISKGNHPIARRSVRSKRNTSGRWWDDSHQA
ncbi:hypothetical protein C2S52_008674 [Perilla frutescens var. hirtella]|nr:hypothetical protein C2S52_008674 [Perilla frutescens var. hirtella]